MGAERREEGTDKGGRMEQGQGLDSWIAIHVRPTGWLFELLESVRRWAGTRRVELVGVELVEKNANLPLPRRALAASSRVSVDHRKGACCVRLAKPEA